VKNFSDIEVLGKTLDDAAGEAFDKTGKLLGLDYPAGPIIDKLANSGNVVYEFPEPKIPGLDFSFSGLKTSILYFIEKKVKEDKDFVKNNLNDLCASVQSRIVSILINKLVEAAEMTGITDIAIAGGVSANSSLRKALQEKSREYGWKTYIPRLEYCTDNAAMVGISAFYKFIEKDFADMSLNSKARY
jgi:N6-L-threonylcarbamoyladenine synthase